MTAAPRVHVEPQAAWPFEGLTPFKYGAILADPPWSYEMRGPTGYEKSPEAHYETMQLADIKALPVGTLASGDCLLFLWSTWPHLQQAMETMTAWGFTYKTGGSWIKRTKHGKTAFGTGYIFRSACEPYLIGTIGNPLIRSRSERNVIEVEEIPDLIDAERREHSRKPREMREMIGRLCPQYFAAELFGREAWPGHDVWGNQTDRFTQAADRTMGSAPV